MHICASGHVGVVRGIQKAEAILGATAGGYVNVVLTDSLAALEVVHL